MAVAVAVAVAALPFALVSTALMSTALVSKALKASVGVDEGLPRTFCALVALICILARSIAVILKSGAGDDV